MYNVVEYDQRKTAGPPHALRSLSFDLSGLPHALSHTCAYTHTYTHTHSLTHSLSHSRTHALTHSLNHTYSPTAPVVVAKNSAMLMCTLLVERYSVSELREALNSRSSSKGVCLCVCVCCVYICVSECLCVGVCSCECVGLCVCVCVYVCMCVRIYLAAPSPGKHMCIHCSSPHTQSQKSSQLSEVCYFPIPRPLRPLHTPRGDTFPCVCTGVCVCVCVCALQKVQTVHHSASVLLHMRVRTTTPVTIPHSGCSPSHERTLRYDHPVHSLCSSSLFTPAYTPHSAAETAEDKAREPTPDERSPSLPQLVMWRSVIVTFPSPAFYAGDSGYVCCEWALVTCTPAFCFFLSLSSDTHTHARTRTRTHNYTQARTHTLYV